MNKAHEQLVDSQFGPRAKAYVESAVHARGPDLDALEAVVGGVRPARALDLGTGGGHVAYVMARHAGSVTASDLSPEMLAAVAAAAKDRGLTNVEVAEASAERLKFENECFDFLGCRYSAHHWRNLEAGLREARRVLKSGSKAVFIDAVAPEAAALDTHLQAVELLRYTSHVRDYTTAEWIAALAEALDHARQRGGESATSMVAFSILAMVARRQGGLTEAVAYFTESEAHARLTEAVASVQAS